MFIYTKSQVEKKIQDCFNMDMLDKYNNLDDNPLKTFQYLLGFLQQSQHGEIRNNILSLIDSINQIQDEYSNEKFENLPSNIISEFAYIMSSCRF